MNPHILTLVHLMAQQATRNYRENPRLFVFTTIINHLSETSKAALLEIAHGIKQRTMQ